MKISEQWLREWVSPEVDTQTLAEQLTMAGLEVDGVTAAAPELNGVVVGKVLEKTQHPNADRLSVCKVDIGSAEPLQIVCGAANVYAGGVFPVATVGTRLPGGLKIKKSRLRGEESRGMLCSGAELNMAEDADGLMELPGDLIPGTSVSEALKLDDQIIELDLTPNRADCFSVLGVARDLAAFNELPFSIPEIESVAAAADHAHRPGIAPEQGCPAFATRVIRGLNAGAETPFWLAERLRRSGVRPLHPVVDVTNYVMLELGQPMHAYDLAKLNGTLHARLAQRDEALTLLDGQEVKLDEDVLVIADDSGPVAMAGIMGGASTAVDEATVDIVLESAFFTPQVMAGRARRFGLHTDASLRFERGVDFAGQSRALERATALILEIAGGQPGAVSDVRDAAALPRRAAVELRRDRLDLLLGVDIAAPKLQGMFERLGFDVQATKGGWQVVPTTARFDIELEVDLIEEVARLHGYDQVPERRLAAAVPLATSSENTVPLERVADLLIDRGYNEVISYSFVDPEQQHRVLGEASELALANPISSELSVMRRSLWPGLLSVAEVNRKRQQERGRIFETGSVFLLQDNEIKEQKVISGVAWGAVIGEHWDDASSARRRVDLFDIKADLDALLQLGGRSSDIDYVASEHPSLRPGRTARIERKGVMLGWLGELHPRVAKRLNISGAPVLFELLADHALSAQLPEYQQVSRFPSVRRDLAVVVAEAVTAGEILNTVRAAAGDVLQDVKLFDVYRGESIETGLKSVALGLILQETSRTLTELEIDGVVNAVIESLSSKLNASIRE